MFTKLLLIAVLAVLYGLAWHNQPAKPASIDGQSNRLTPDPKKPDQRRIEV